MMNNYNDNRNNINNEELAHYESNPYVTSYNNIQTASAPVKQKKHTGAKAVAFVLAMALVSGGSIACYRTLEINEPASTSTSSSSSKDENENVTPVDKEMNALSVKALSLIDPTESGSKVLTTEEIAEKVMPSVVGIESTFSVPNNQGSFYFGFGEFGGNNDSSSATGTGTGVIITSDGYIVTNAHVIYDSEHGAGKAESISVLLDDEKSYDAEIVGYDTDYDLAVLKIDADEDLTPAEFGKSDNLKLGEDVVAIGNPLGFDLMNTVTRGIVSGLDRKITINDKNMSLIQTDAAINSGNSGGPLINKYGQVIGINSSKMSNSYSSGATIEGIGFAIPSDIVSKIIDDLMEYGYVTGKPQFGISCQDVTETVSKMYNLPIGVYVTAVSEDSAAEKAGLKPGDIITGIDDVEVKTSEELNAQKNTHQAGDKIKLTFIRNDEEKTVTITLDEVKKNK